MRDLSEIAIEIEQDWSSIGKGVNYAARPYLDAMKTLKTMEDHYYYDDAESIVLYFLANAVTWRGDVARRVKAELKDMTK